MALIRFLYDLHWKLVKLGKEITDICLYWRAMKFYYDDLEWNLRSGSPKANIFDILFQQQHPMR